MLSLGACHREKVYRIGVSQCSQDDWRQKMNEEIEREMMFHEDAEVEIRSANDDSRKQIADINYFIDNDFDILIVSPNEAESLTPVIREIYKKGFPVIIFDRSINDTTYTAHIGVDDVGLGRAAAEYALSLSETAPKVIEVFGLPGSTPAENRHKGFKAALESGGGNIVASAPGNWFEDKGAHVADSMLRAHPEANFIYAHNDRMAIGASEVARRMGRHNVRIAGTDAAPEIGVKAVADSVIDVSFLYPTEGYRLIRTALSILKGEPYQKETLIPASSAVDRSNADILLIQNETLEEETGKMRTLKRQLDDYWSRHTSQTMLFYASIVIILLLIGVVFLILRAYWQRKEHQSKLEEQNHELEKQRDMQRELNSRLEEATQSKLMFFTNVSHDLRTPLTLIAEPVAQLASASNLTPRQQTLTRIADKNVRILQRLINQILDFRKYENGKLDLHLSEIDLGHAILDWTEAFHGIALQRHLHLSVEARTNSAPVMIAVDVEKIERVFFNLLSNAIKYTRENGRITVAYGVSDTDITITVSDTGEGISERDLGNIFDRFYQVDRVHLNGSGIGLSVTKAFVELHGGTITVTSEVNKGSTFTVTLPIRHVDNSSILTYSPSITKEAVESELNEVENEHEFADDRKVLLVIDDNADIREMLTELLGDEYNVMTASDGSQGVRMALRYVPDLVVCDVMMPVMDGLETCRRLKEDVVTSHIPVLMLTACSLDEQRVQGYDSGADGYLSKPFSEAVLKSRIASLITNRLRIRELWKGSSAILINDEQHQTVSQTKATTAVPGNIDNDFYNRFLTIFKEEMGKSEVNVDYLAAKMGLERTQFYRKIKAITNYTPVELIRQLRLKEAQRILKTTDASISEIAYAVGFSTPAYFTKCYRETFGETPTETRARLNP